MRYRIANPSERTLSNRGNKKTRTLVGRKNETLYYNNLNKQASVYYDKNTGAIESNQSMFERSDVSIVKTFQTAKLPILVTRSLCFT